MKMDEYYAAQVRQLAFAQALAQQQEAERQVRVYVFPEDAPVAD